MKYLKKLDVDVGELTAFAGAGMLALAGGVVVARYALKKVFDWAAQVVMSDAYGENMLEFYSASTRVGAQNIAEITLRAEEGQVLSRPLGSPKKMPDFKDLMFNMAQLHKLPTPADAKIALAVTIGPQAKKPLHLSIPIIISGMAYGEALSAAAKIALARGATIAGTAINCGEGPFLAKERQAAKHYIHQYNRAAWSKEDEVLKQADAIEIQIGQGAIAGVGHFMRSKQIDSNLRKRMGLQKEQDAVVHSRQTQTDTVSEFKHLVNHLRELTGGVPIGAKIGAGMDIEDDLNFLIQSGVDFVCVDGAQAATHGSAPILQDDFGIPTLFAVCRASRYFEKCKVKGKVTLLVSGGLFTPGDFLKAIALGADAVCIGTAALFAVTHAQALKTLPYEPPTQVLWYDGKYSGRFNVQEGAKALGRYLKACAEEMALGVMGVGKKGIKELCADDLCGLTPQVCEVAQVKPAWKEL